MPYVLALATPAIRELVVEALRARADTMTRAARRGAAEVATLKREGKDVRSRSVQLVAMLGDASELEAIATELENLEELAIVQTTDGLSAVPIPEPAAGDATTTGPSPAAVQLDATDEAVAAVERIEQLADLAGLAPALVDGDDDPEAGSEPADDVAAALEVVGS